MGEGIYILIGLSTFFLILLMGVGNAVKFSTSSNEKRKRKFKRDIERGYRNRNANKRLAIILGVATAALLILDNPAFFAVAPAFLWVADSYLGEVNREKSERRFVKNFMERSERHRREIYKQYGLDPDKSYGKGKSCKKSC